LQQQHHINTIVPIQIIKPPTAAQIIIMSIVLPIPEAVFAASVSVLFNFSFEHVLK